MKKPLLILVAATLLTFSIFGLSTLLKGERSHGVVENISGIPFPETPDHSILITEELAHTDIHLTEPVFAKNLTLQITFKPGNLNNLAVGIREDSFWLSYGSKQQIFSGSDQASTLVIPLTDKFQDTDRSLDVMFFATAQGNEQPKWELQNLSAKVEYAHPSWTEFKKYARSILKRERAL